MDKLKALGQLLLTSVIGVVGVLFMFGGIAIVFDMRLTTNGNDLLAGVACAYVGSAFIINSFRK